MFAYKIAGPSLRCACYASQPLAISVFRPTVSRLRYLSQQRAQYAQLRSEAPRPNNEQPPIPEEVLRQAVDDASDDTYTQFPKVKVRYLIPAIWALSVSGGIFYGLAYLEAKSELKSKPASSGGWLQAPQWSTKQRGPPTPTEVVTGAWTNLDPISRVTYGIIGANSGIHLSSFLLPRAWETLWHLPARNVNYTQFTSMFVHGGALHFFVNMYFLNNFMAPVGYSRLFEGSPYHTLSFYLSAGVLSGFAQHWTTLSTRIPFHRRPIPEIFIRSGGASGALFGILGVFCMQYPHAGLGILFVPVHFDAQYVLPAILLFDLVGIIRGYSFVNFGHAAHFAGGMLGVAYSYFDGKTNIWKPLNDLMTMMIGIHANIVDGRGADLDFHYTTDESLLEAFQHLRDQIGRNSHAENFLICFAGRTAPSISELERNLDTAKTDPAIRNEILAEARSFSPDPIKNQPEMFFVNDGRPPYPQLEIQPNKTGLDNGRWTSTHTTHPIDVNDADRPQLTKTFGEFGNGTQKHSSKIPKHKYHVGHLRSPDSTHTLLHSSFSNQPDEACDPGVRIHVGDPDDPNLSYPSQGVENHNGDLSASTVDHDGVLHLDRPLSLPLPSALPPLSSPSPPSASLQCPRPPVSSHTHLSSHRAFVGSQDRGLKAPCVIQVYQYNNKAHDNAYRIQNESESTVAAQVQGRGKGGDRTVRTVANSGRQSQKLIRQKKGKRCRWFCPLTCGSKHY
ncbi:hypothetical protein AG0111_0g471 [Alternaria gaisen]|uniref:Uncharacterized protein n=1 Tax=Alternaria gaisen TaxID=167740 RepID=A0ACB6G048_9PLEO|nr:hypothetical protein AG0111_0g471 [Alternaria gaisen]